MLAGAGSLAGLAVRMYGGAHQKTPVRAIPEGGLQPQAAVDERGTLHLVYYAGDPKAGDLLYATSRDGGATFSSAIRVNSQAGSALALGTIRGGQIALGKAGRLHVAWNGSSAAAPPGPLNPDSHKPGSPMLYARLNDAGTAFEAQRNVMLESFGLDGGGSLAADRAGNVEVAWHGIGEDEATGTGKTGEARRRVWLAGSTDDGRSFAAERKAWAQDTGACGCCGMKIYADARGRRFALYRSATESVHRDIYLLTSEDGGQSFEGRLLHRWAINACPMSSMDITGNGSVVVGAWETGGQVYWARLDGGNAAPDPVAAPGEGKSRKHPRVAVNRRGEMLLAWTEGTGWQKGGSLAWQLYDATGRPTAERGWIPGIPVWSFAAVAAFPDDRFAILR